MPRLAGPAVQPGTLSRVAQPTIPVADTALLRPWRADDAGAVFGAFQDSGIQRWHARRLDSLSEAHQVIESWRGGWSTEEEAHWAITDAVSDQVLGRIALKRIDFFDGSAELGYWVLPAARGRGLCPAAVEALSEWAFDVVGLVRLDLQHSMSNEASCRVATKAGFAVEGIRRSASLHADGWHDMHLHSRSRIAAVTPAVALQRPIMALDVAGLSLDCSDPGELTAFYLRLLGGNLLWSDASSAGLRTPLGLIVVAQHVREYVRPVWPGTSVVHLDLDAGGSLEAAVRHAIDCGATQADSNTDPRWTVLLDPAGHPFCVTTMTWQD